MNTLPTFEELTRLVEQRTAENMRHGPGDGAMTNADRISPMEGGNGDGEA